MISAIQGVLKYAALCGQVPEWHRMLLGNPLLTALMPAMETQNQVLVFTLQAINERASIKRDGELIKADTEGWDMMSKWAYVKSGNPDKMSTRDIVVHLSGNVFAGSDTTAIALRAIIYFLCQHPECMQRLVSEIQGADSQRLLSTPIRFKEATTHLPYLNGVIKESMRLHPSVGLLLERYVPPEGLEVDGHHIPAGAIVGINPWVTNRDRKIFPDPDAFKPERWLQQVSGAEHLKKMDEVWEFNFGAGSRKCIGRNISWLEIQKVIPEMFRLYEVELADPSREWKVVNHWFAQQEGLICHLKRRRASS